MECKDCLEDKRIEEFCAGGEYSSRKSYHHHCKTCNAWQFGDGEVDVYGNGECYGCAVKRINESAS